MNNNYGCAPIYFSGALLFLVSGGTLIYQNNPIIGAIVIVPGLILVGVKFFTLVMLSRIKRGEANLPVVVNNPELLKHIKNNQKTRVSQKKRKRKD